MNSESSNVCGVAIRSESSGRFWSVNKKILKWQYQNKKTIKVRIQPRLQENRKPLTYCTKWQKVTPFNNGESVFFQLCLTKGDLENIVLDCVDIEFIEKYLEDLEDRETSQIDDLDSCYRKIHDSKGDDLLPLYAYCVNKKFYVGCAKSEINTINKDDPRIFTIDDPYLKHEYLKGNMDNKSTPNFNYYVAIEQIQVPVWEATLQKCGEITIEVSQQRCGKVVQQKCSEVTHQERSEETQQECRKVTHQERSEETQQQYGQVTHQECGEVTQQQYGQVTQQKCGQVPQQECSEATQQECGEFSSAPEENVEETTSYIFSLTLVEIKQNANKWDVESVCTN